MIYFDNNATTRLLPEVLEAMVPYLSERYFNPTSVAGALQDVGKPLRDARESLAKLIDCQVEEVVLTSGATESNNWVLQSVARRAVRETGKCHLLVSAIEHSSVLEAALYLANAESGVDVDLVPVTDEGVVDLRALRTLVRPDTVLVSVMLANNETGVIQPLAEVAAISKEVSAGCVIHTDATQAVGKILVSLQSDLKGVDFLSLSAHKFNGPKGIGALYIRSGIELDPLIHGGGQQGGARSGTESPALAAGIAKAGALAAAHLGDQRLLELRDSLEASLGDLPTMVLGRNAPRLPNTSLLLFENVDAEVLIHQLLEAGFATSTGSACLSGSDTPSHVVLAMGIGYGLATGVLRVSLGCDNTERDIANFVVVLRDLISNGFDRPTLDANESEIGG